MQTETKTSPTYFTVDTSFKPPQVICSADGIPFIFDSEGTADRFGNENSEGGYMVALLIHEEKN